ncbi:MAG: ATP synthase F0 subunit B [Pseudomonadota bacterium]|uniref:ATP synthase subunit b n=1 Tax=Candidatus Desulfatibia profunda TaxID=2841695 RepID=A0A8J6NUZ2_9BACT|nr:ATP synthase F0 subunit B [Candidatus Desulfatibia profunda]MBL7180596.1 ATP synthase F0 subunit B [Desulfobacterales bacterium]MBU0699384.1 ATP synthase F0 subunit B [Pseudomonadota bacterium]
MKNIHKLMRVSAWIMCAALSLHLFGFETFAAEGTSSWRPIYDLIMRWVNFGIIVFVVYKYARKPLMNFLRGRKENLAQEIKELEDQRADTAAKIKETQNFIEESDVRFADLKERIVQQGEKKKQEIIESAKQQNQMMLNNARRRVEFYMIEAKNTFKAELVDAAINLAMQRLPQEITTADNENFANEYLAGTMTK